MNNELIVDDEKEDKASCFDDENRRIAEELIYSDVRCEFEACISMEKFVFVVVNAYSRMYIDPHILYD